MTETHHAINLVVVTSPSGQEECRVNIPAEALDAVGWNTDTMIKVVPDHTSQRLILEEDREV
jgi:hypothetical protein